MIAEHLYFIAIIPPEPIRGKIEDIKVQFATQYKVYHALKSPPHITLIPPFRLCDDYLPKLRNLLTNCSSQLSPVNISIKNYGCFKPSVIYLKPILNDKLQAIQQQINSTFYDGFPSLIQSNRPFHPHLTIAYRDLTPKIFDISWTKFKKRRFESEFAAEAVSLLMHDGKGWIEHLQFELKGQDLPA